MALNRAQFTKQLNLGLNTVFGMEYDRYPEQWRAIYSTEQSMKAFEEDVQMIGFGEAPTKAEGAMITYDSGREGYVARYVHETVALAFSITLSMKNLIRSIISLLLAASCGLGTTTGIDFLLPFQ